MSLSSSFHSKQSPSSDMNLRCYTCLSLDRNLKILKHEQKFILAMLCPEMFSKAKLNTHYPICWECESIIGKIRRFQARLMKAQLKITLTLQGTKTFAFLFQPAKPRKRWRDELKAYRKDSSTLAQYREGWKGIKKFSAIVEGLSTLKITVPETINVTPQAPEIVQINQNQQILIEIPHQHPTTPVPLKVEPETIKIEVEEEQKCAEEINSDYDEVIQATKIQQASSDESTDTASEIDMYDDPLMTQKEKYTNIIVKCAKMPVPPQKPIKAAIISPNVKFNCRPQKVFINAPKEKLAIRGYKETVKVTGGVPNLVTVKESVPMLVKGKTVSLVVKDEGSVPIAVKDEQSVRIAVKDERRVPMLIKSQGRVSIVLKDKGRSLLNRLTGKGKSVPNRVKGPTREELILKRQTGPYNSNLRREPPPKQPQTREPEYEQTAAGFYGYDEDEAKCVILTKSELIAYRDKQRLRNGYKGHGYNCDRCIEKFINQKNLDEHNKKHDESQGNSVCELCEQRFPNDSYRDEHYKLHFRIYKCLKCPYQNNELLKITEHFRRNHEVSVFGCKKCEAVFKTYKEKRKHIVDVHSKKERQKCAECNKTFSSMPLLKTHMATHERETTDCTVCHKKVRKNYLDKHMKTHEDTGEDSAYCVDCKKVYKNEKCYNLHLKTSLKHNSVEEVGIKCDHCNKFFAGSIALKNHLEEVSGVRYTCDICKKDSKNKVALARHIRLVHKKQKSQQKPKICEYCGKSFSIKKSLEQHINKHLGYRPHVCKDCGATFIYSAALFTHRRLVHKVKRRYEMTS